MISIVVVDIDHDHHDIDEDKDDIDHCPRCQDVRDNSCLSQLDKSTNLKDKDLMYYMYFISYIQYI